VPDGGIIAVTGWLRIGPRDGKDFYSELVVGDTWADVTGSITTIASAVDISVPLALTAIVQPGGAINWAVKHEALDNVNFGLTATITKLGPLPT
jgi:hypothetical protein